MFTIKILDHETGKTQKTIKADKKTLLNEVISLCEQEIDTEDVKISSAKGEILAADLCEYLPVMNSVVRVYNDREWTEPIALGMITMPTHAIMIPKQGNIKKGFKFLVESNGWRITDDDIICEVCPISALPDMPIDDQTKQLEYIKNNCIEASLFRTEHVAGDVMASCNDKNANAMNCFDFSKDQDDNLVVLNRYGVYVGIPAIDNPEMGAMCVHEIYDESGYTVGYCMNVGNGEICMFGDPDRYIEDFFVGGEYYSMGEFLGEFLFDSERMFEKYFDCFTNETFLSLFCKNVPEWLTVFTQDRNAFWMMFKTLADDCLRTDFEAEIIQKIFDNNAEMIQSTVKKACKGFKKRVGAF